MPLNPNSLKVTEAYRGRMVGIRDRAKRQAQNTWAKVELEDLDRTYDPGLLAIRVAMMQREAAELSAGYLGAFIASETGQKIPLPTAVALQAGQARSGEGLRKAFQSPLIGVKVDIKDGMDSAQALHKGGSRLVRQAGLATDEAAREALRLAMDAASEVEGWKRAVKGTCDACMGMADGSTAPAGTPLEIHPDCSCVSEAVVKPTTPTSAMRDAAVNYESGYGVNYMNELRAADGDLAALSAEGQADVRALNALIDMEGEAAPVLYRAVDQANLPGSIGTALFGKGREFREWGLSASSANSKFPEIWKAAKAEAGVPLKKPVIFEIQGGRGLDVEKFAQQHLEVDIEDPDVQEWWLKPGTKYKVLSSHKTPRGLEVTVRVVDE